MSRVSEQPLSKYDSLPERKYHVAPRQRRHRRPPPLIPALLGLLLFCGGFLLGKASATPNVPFSDMEASVPVISLPQVKHETEDIQEGPSESVSATQEEAAAEKASAAPNAPLSDTEASVPVIGLPQVEHAAEDIQERSSEAVGATQEETPVEVEWNLILVNGEHPLPEDFQVPALTQLRNGHAIDSRAYPALQKMMDAARAEGLEPLICSSFRTWDKQEELFSNKVQSYLNQGYSQAEAEENAAFWVARPGTSEHQAGLAVDIVDVSYQLLDEKQEETPVQLWLMEHCAEYGFILRYPTDKSDLTGVGYEPWHYRYVGEAAAKEIIEQGICLEEYYSNIYG